MFSGEKYSRPTIQISEALEFASSQYLDGSRKYLSLPASMSRLLRWATVFFVGVCITFYVGMPGVFPSKSSSARAITARELMARPLSQDVHSIPKLFHQSWSSDKIPSTFEYWSGTCRAQHPDWEWVLWTDEDNEELVKLHFPWFLETYQKLPGVINRADVARNMYMYIYGGVYADFDTECLRPLDEMFEKYNFSTVSHLSTLPPNPPPTSYPHPPSRAVFLGQMGKNLNFPHALPNAWLASTPGQPFWLLSLEGVKVAVREADGGFTWPENLTGPVALRGVARQYLLGSDFNGDRLEKHIAGNPTAAKTFGARPGLSHTLHILPHYYIYPFSWSPDGEDYRNVCEVNKPDFNPRRCKDLVAADHWPSYTITYWSHTWTVGQGHNRENLHLVGGDRSIRSKP